MTRARESWGWRLERRAAPSQDQGVGPVRWTDATGMTVRVIGEGAYRVEVPGIAGDVRPGERSITIAPLDPAAGDEQTLDHLLVDQLLPRALAHDGALLLLHGGAVGIDGRAVLLLGATGAGKSTLSASFAREGHVLLGDDAQAVRLDPGGPQVRAVAPGLRLLPDALAALYPDPPELTALAHYTPKQRLGGVAREEGWLPVAAIFVLDAAPPAGEEVEVTRSSSGGQRHRHPGGTVSRSIPPTRRAPRSGWGWPAGSAAGSGSCPAPSPPV